MHGIPGDAGVGTGLATLGVQTPKFMPGEVSPEHPPAPELQSPGPEPRGEYGYGFSLLSMSYLCLLFLDGVVKSLKSKVHVVIFSFWEPAEQRKYVFLSQPVRKTPVFSKD